MNVTFRAHTPEETEWALTVSRTPEVARGEGDTERAVLILAAEVEALNEDLSMS